MQTSPTKSQIDAAVAAGESAAASAARLRKRFARRKTPTRDEQLTAARESCAAAAKPLRAFIGMVAWHDIPVADELAMKGAVEKLRYERRQIDKML